MLFAQEMSAYSGRGDSRKRCPKSVILAKEVYSDHMRVSRPYCKKQTAILLTFEAAKRVGKRSRIGTGFGCRPEEC